MKSEALVRYRWLDLLPARLFDRVVGHAHGRLVDRGRALVALREALLAGHVPPAAELPWPEEAVRLPLMQALLDANVAPYCVGDPEIVDDVLGYLLDVVHEAHDFKDRAMVAFHFLAQKDRDRFGYTSGCGDAGGSSLDASLVENLEREAVALVCELVRAKVQHWAELGDAFAQLDAIFRTLAERLSLPPGAQRGMLRALSRETLYNARRMLERLPSLEALIQVLGRMQECQDENGTPILERIASSVERRVHVEIEQEGGVSAEARGIERSGEFARMLPSEAMLLAHPVLKRLWLARWAEHSLLTYHAPDVGTADSQAQRTFEDGEATRNSRPHRGPVVVILDTSGSMEGAPETIAKAVILQLAGVAFMERRRMFLYNFSAAGDVLELELSLEGPGLGAMMYLISSSFHGGTDVVEPIRRACARLKEPAFRQADLLIASDGEFAVPREVLARMSRARKHAALRVHGLAVGAGAGFAELGCDHIHNVWSWLPKR